MSNDTQSKPTSIDQTKFINDVHNKQLVYGYSTNACLEMRMFIEQYNNYNKPKYSSIENWFGFEFLGDSLSKCVAWRRY